MDTQQEKRRHRRVPVKLPAKMRWSSDAPGVAVVVGNVAPGGIFVESDQPPPAGAEIELRFRMLADRTCEARGRVAWQDPGGFGIAFDDTNDDMDRFTAQLLVLPPHLHLFYLADVIHPELRVAA